MGHSVLAIPVPALEPYVRGRWEHYDPRWVSPDPAFTHAHITALAPFRPAPTASDLDVIATIAGRLAAFEFELAEVAAFPDGLIHVLPSPLHPFAELTRLLAAAFPDCPPYAGQFADVVPHLTLDRVGPGVSVASVAADLAGVLPARTTAERLELHWYDEGDCRVLAGWPLAAVSARA